MNGIRKKPGSFALGSFTIIELMIAIVIVIILAAIAVPSYLGHLRQAEFSSTVAAANSLKPVVAQCIEKRKTLIGCSQNSYSIPAAVEAAAGVPGVSVVNGVITATASPDADYDVAGTTYVLTPTYTAGSAVTWKASGSGCTYHYADC